jgi:hypothetical protein
MRGGWRLGLGFSFGCASGFLLPSLARLVLLRFLTFASIATAGLGLLALLVPFAIATAGRWFCCASTFLLPSLPRV